MSTKALIVLALAKEATGTNLRINTVRNFQSMKSGVELNRLFLKFVLCQVDIQENYSEDNAKFNFLGIIWESKMSWRVHFSDFQKSLKSKILASMVPPSGCAGFITNLPLCATRRLERMYY